MKQLLCLLFFLFSVKINAQNTLPKPYEITTDTIKKPIGVPDSCWQVLADKNSRWAIEQVSASPVTDGFLAPDPKTKKVDQSILTYWFRYRLRNAMNKDAGICIWGGADHDDIYYKDSTGNWDSQVSGFAQPWSKRDGFKRMRMMPLVIKPHQEILIYERRTTNKYSLNKSDVTDVGFMFTQSMLQQYYIDNDSYAWAFFIFGLFIVAALFNLYFFFVVSERVYLYFSLTVLFISFERFLEGSHIFFREHPVYEGHMWYACIGLFLFFLLQFVRYFLETFRYMPRWDKFLIGINICTTALFILLLLTIIRPNYVSAGWLAAAFFTLISFLFVVNSPSKPVRQRAMAALPGVILLLITVIFSLIDLLSYLLDASTPTFIASFVNHFVLWEEISFMWLFIIFTVYLFKRYQQLQKQMAFEAAEKERLAKEKEIEKSQMIEQQKIELEKTVEERTAELKQSLNELKSTQAQLIQSEKMASLGELTAGIAHEIQNPLNFVNNFSEVNKEMIDDLQSELKQGNVEEAVSISNDIKANEEKINHHGKRADAIVKGMLQHSRSSSGHKELTDINALCDEYLRLSYHGLRAKDKSFNAKFETDLDPSIGKINIVPQDVGRVLLNLINNAFYAVNEKVKQGVNSYEPLVIIGTRRINDKVEIKVKDNGNGISQNVLDKIFQPFFTTKPTGQGTGLGLSLAYDIIKTHGGEIKVETKNGEGTEFTVQLPMNTS